MYKVIKAFTDLHDEDYPYSVEILSHASGSTSRKKGSKNFLDVRISRVCRLLKRSQTKHCRLQSGKL